jgi:hypothetical protein
LLHRHERPEKRDEHRRRSFDALALELQYVAHLVYPDENNDPHCKPHRKQQRVRPDTDQHRERRPYDLYLQQEQCESLELGEQQPEGRERRQQSL